LGRAGKDVLIHLTKKIAIWVTQKKFRGVPPLQFYPASASYMYILLAAVIWINQSSPKLFRESLCVPIISLFFHFILYIKRQANGIHDMIYVPWFRFNSGMLVLICSSKLLP
jgi:hypothetical protein